jgi:drug/metabolite transporter (DMT)-like permease
MLALVTALLSGISVFANGFAVKGFDPFVFTTMKNLSAVALIGASVLAFSYRKELFSLTKVQFAKLVLIGAIGGSIPFLLFFWGLSLSSGAIGSFIYRLLFVFASGIAIFALKETVSRKYIFGGALSVGGNALLLSGQLAFGFGEFLVLLATILWAIEFNISKKVMADISPRIVSFGRMFFGAIILLTFLFAIGKLDMLFVFSTPVQLEWFLVTALFLSAYLICWYPALKELPVSVATPVLALGGLVSTGLAFVFAGKAIAPVEAFGMLAVLAGISFMANLHSLVLKFFSCSRA